MSVWYTMDKKGVSAILKTPQTKAALAALAEKKTDEANRLLHAHNPRAGKHEYMHHDHDLRYTSIESVHTTGATTEYDHRMHHTLDAINH